MDALCGWAGPVVAEQAWGEIGHLFPKFMVVGAGESKPRAMLWELIRKVLGHDLPAEAQEIGDCVSWGAKHAVETVSCVEIFNGDAEDFHYVFSPYLYQIGRVLVGKGQMGNSDGSVGSWQAKAVELYGVLRSDFPGCPAYSGAVAKKWGNSQPAADFLAEGKVHLIQTTSKINSWDELHIACSNGYPSTIASNQGFKGMTPGADGFHAPSGTWGHQMCIIGTVDDPNGPHGSYACIMNSWGDVHGALTDFATGDKWPAGTLRVRRSVIEHMIATGECIAYSQFKGFPAQKIDWTQMV